MRPRRTRSGVTELLKNGGPRGELCSMRDAKFVPEKTTLVLSNQHNAWLDELSAAIRRNTGAAISRSALVRATIAAMSRADLDLSGCNSEGAVRELVLARLNSAGR